MIVSLEATRVEQKPVLWRLFQLYAYDFSEISGEIEIGPEGTFEYAYFDLYWTEPGRYPYLIRLDGKLAGFVLVNEHACRPEVQYSIAEFFILRPYRHTGIGKQAAFAAFDLFRGRWEVREIPENTGATAFWRRVIAEYTGGAFEEAVMDDDCWQGPVQWFDNRLERVSG